MSQQQICEVCGKKFRALNLNHLRTHGIVSWEQYEELVAKRQRPDQNLIREVAHGLLHRQEIPEEHARRLAEINAGRQNNMRGMMAVTDMRQMLRLVRLMEKLDRMDGVALDEERLAEYSFEQLLEMMKFVSGDITTIIKQLSEDSKKGAGFAGAVENLFHSTTYNFVQANGHGTEFDGRLPQDPRAQAGLMEQVNELLGKFRQGVLPAPPQPATPGPPPVQEGGVIDVGDGNASSQ